MDIDKALNQAPLGLSAEDMMGQEPDIEIEIEDPEEVTIRSGDMEIEIDPDEEENDEFNENLAETLDEGQLTQLAGDLLGEFEEDLSSRKDWIQTYVDGLELLGETMMETFPAAGPVRTEIIGKETNEKRDAAARVQADMNYQLTDVMVEYRPEHERMLWGLGLAGNAFKKVYFDPSLGRQASMYLPAEDVVVPYGASSLEVAGRVTHVMRKTPNELKKLQASGRPVQTARNARRFGPT